MEIYVRLNCVHKYLVFAGFSYGTTPAPCTTKNNCSFARTFPLQTGRLAAAVNV